MIEEDLHRSPACLLVPGLGNSGAGHWQTIWEAERADCSLVELGCWDDPVRNVWMNRIDQAVSASSGPVILVAHSLGCLAVAWWASLLGESVSSAVRGALLVAPPDVDRAGVCPAIARFAPAPRAALPFPAILAASSDDPYCGIDRAEQLAGGWLAEFVALGEAGHLNASSGLGGWEDGQLLLDRLIDGGGRTGRDRIVPPTPFLVTPALSRGPATSSGR